MPALPTFATFRNGFGGDVCRRLGVDISTLETWDDYTSEIIRYNNSTRHFPFIAAAEKFGGIASSGERVVLGAVLAAADFCAQADELCGGGWGRVLGLGDRARETIAAAVLRID